MGREGFQTRFPLHTLERKRGRERAGQGSKERENVRERAAERGQQRVDGKQNATDVEHKGPYIHAGGAGAGSAKAAASAVGEVIGLQKLCHVSKIRIGRRQ